MLLRDGVRCHPKVLTAGAEAAWLWACCIDYSRQQLTDGFVPDAALPTLAACKSKLPDLTTRLVAVGLLHREEAGFRVHDYLDHNDSAAKVKEDKRKDADRKRGGKATDSDPTPDGFPTDSERTLARARGVGVGVSGSALNGRGAGEGVEPAQVPNCEAYAEAWREAASAAGTDLRLGLSQTEVGHLLRLAPVYNVEDFALAARAFWASAHTGGHNLGLFASQIAEVLGHLRSGATWPYRAPPPAQKAKRFNIDAWAAKGASA